MLRSSTYEVDAALAGRDARCGSKEARPSYRHEAPKWLHQGQTGDPELGRSPPAITPTAAPDEGLSGSPETGKSFVFRCPSALRNPGAVAVLSYHERLPNWAAD